MDGALSSGMDESACAQEVMWLEIITLRTPELGSVEAQVAGAMRSLALEAPQIRTAVYRRAPTDTDLAVHLRHRTSLTEFSAPGERLAAAFRSFGTVNHSLWRLETESAARESNQENEKEIETNED